MRVGHYALAGFFSYLRIAPDELCILSPAGLTSLSEARVEIAPGEHVLIIGEPRSGKTRLFLAMAGLWTSGSGRIRLPSAESVLFVPKRAYIPDLSLRAIISYPSPSSDFSEEANVAALTRFDLGHFAFLLDRGARWEKELTDPEQQRLAFARVLLHKPRFVVVDEAIESLSPRARRTLFDIFGQELAGTALIYVSGPKSQNKFFGHVLHLTLDARKRLPERSAASNARLAN